MNRTPLFDGHVAATAKLVDFAGWDMPLQYTGVVDEYHAVRKAAGLFDVSHMGRISVSGERALPYIQRATTNDASQLGVGQSQYSMVCNPEGGIKDDVFVYRLRPNEFLICVNASNREKLVAWLEQALSDWNGVQVRDRSLDIAQLAVQGPTSRSILTALGLPRVDALKPRHCVEASVLGTTLVIARTGYTGELGYELYLPADGALRLWNEILTAGKPHGLKPVGLGARDLLRLEMAYLLYGNDISEDTTPLEANVARMVAFDKGEFIGRQALEAQRAIGVSRQLVAFELVEKAVPRHGFRIVDPEKPATELGEVTSGNLSPLLQRGIGLCYVPAALASEGSRLAVDIRGKLVPAIVVKPPFYKKTGTRL